MQGDATVMKDKLLAAETRNADLEKEIESSKAVCTQNEAKMQAQAQNLAQSQTDLDLILEV